LAGSQGKEQKKTDDEEPTVQRVKRDFENIGGGSNGLTVQQKDLNLPVTTLEETQLRKPKAVFRWKGRRPRGGKELGSAHEAWGGKVMLNYDFRSCGQGKKKKTAQRRQEKTRLLIEKRQRKRVACREEVPSSEGKRRPAGQVRGSPAKNGEGPRRDRGRNDIKYLKRRERKKEGEGGEKSVVVQAHKKKRGRGV